MNDLSLAGGTDAAAAVPLVFDTTTPGFAKEVLEESRTQPVLVDFWAPWCGPCRTLSPVIEKAVTAANGAVKLAKMNIDEHPQIAGQLGIQSIPAVIAFVDGKPVDGFLGAIPERQVTEFIEKIGKPGGAGPDLNTLIAEADAALAGGDLERSKAFYAAVREREPENVAALVGLARTALKAGSAAEAARIVAEAPAAAANDAGLASVKAEIALAEHAESLCDAAALERRLEADPADHDARLNLALIANARGDRGAAAGALLEIVKADRSWEDDKARKQLVQFFDAWGPKDPATVAGRRRLSSLLFS